MSDAPVAAKGWWEGIKPVNFQWTVLRCDIQVAQELNRGGARVIPDLLQAPLPIFKRRESDNARKMREGGGRPPSLCVKEMPPGGRWPC